MKSKLILCLAFLIPIPAFSDALDSASRIKSSPGLALKILDREGPQANEAWISLELELASKLNQDAKVLDLAASLPQDAASALALRAARLASRAALRLNRPLEARQYLSRLIWEGNLSEPELKAARLDVIESLARLGDGNGAYLSMLRFGQDYGRPSAAQAYRFVEWLSANKMEKQAIDWLPSIDEASPASLLARQRMGLISPVDAAAAARKMLKKQPQPGYWQVLLESAMNQGDKAGEIEAREALLAASITLPVDLTKLYLDYAVQRANELQLLLGDDAAWIETATREAPEAAHAMLYRLALQAPEQTIRDQAALKLIDSLAAQGKAASLLAVLPDPAQLGIAPRIRLGKIAFDASRHDLAANYWASTPLPERMTQLDAALAFARAGRMDEAQTMLQGVLADPAPFDAAGSAQALSTARLIADSGRGGQLARRLIDLVAPELRIDALALAGDAFAATDPEYAAACYLEAALASDPKNYFAQDARQKAAELMARAGLDDDAKAQYRWLIDHTKDASRQAFLRRRLLQLAP